MVNTDPNHKHTYDEQGKMTCCTLEEKIYEKADQPKGEEEESPWKEYLPAIISFVLLITGVIFDNFIKPSFFNGYMRLIWYLVSYAPVGLPVIKDAFKSLSKGSIFSEFFLMTIATIGAFFIGEYAEGVSVMLFYAVGELFQSAAVKRAKGNIKALLDVRPDIVTVLRNGIAYTISPSKVMIGEIIQVKPGEKVALDGILQNDSSSFNTAALTGESKPDTKRNGEQVLAGMINLNVVSEIRVTALFKDSKLSRILELVQEATKQKAPTQLFISKFAKTYTAIVVYLALAICLLPYFFTEHYVFNDWLYRSLVFLVISCPCALVVSVPLGYFGGIGLASKNGILFKGSNFLDVMTKVDTVVMDKTGTLTKGVFNVQKIFAVEMGENELLKLTAALESKSTHPIAIAITKHAGEVLKGVSIENIEEISGHGLSGKINGNQVLAGNLKLLKKYNIAFDNELENFVESMVAVAVNGKYAGYIIVADELKDDVKQAIIDLHALNMDVIVLSGDKQSVVNKVAKELNIKYAFGSLLPEDKVNKVKELKKENRTIAFIGDGINDAPVLALADAGIAMGGMGSDAAIETADIVIQNDMPSKIVSAIKIGKVTRSIVWQSIILALGVKVVVMALGAGGVATLWEAVFADVGVALLAILNAVRVQRVKV
jgi:Cd2+/Zn2+-exporting ATPase